MLRKGTVLQDINSEVALDSYKDLYFFCNTRADIFTILKSQLMQPVWEFQNNLWGLGTEQYRPATARLHRLVKSIPWNRFFKSEKLENFVWRAGTTNLCLLDSCPPQIILKFQHRHHCWFQSYIRLKITYSYP